MHLLVSEARLDWVSIIFLFLCSTVPKGNSNWKVESFKYSVNETDHGDCCPYKFSQISYSMKIRRLFGYQMFYVFAPCCILTILSMFSFLIPSESGERIGFVTTLLLSLMVYLLVVPDSLPVSSKEIPILGIIIMATLVIISFVLLATIIILICFFRTDIPPKWLRCLTSKKHSYRESTPVKVQVDSQKESFSLRAVPPGFDTINGSEEIPAKLSTPEEPRQNTSEQVSGEVMWQDISRKLDAIVFWIFVLASAISYSYFVVSGMRDKAAN